MRFFSALLDLVLPRDPAREAARAATADDFAALLDRRVTPGSGIVSYLRFGNPLVRAAVHELKYRGHAPLARALAGAVTDELIADIGERTLAMRGGPTTIVPVPLSRAHARERGFNQSDLIAQAIAERAGHGTFTIRTDVVERVREGPSQTSFSERAAREENVRNAFAVPDPARVPRGLIVVLDDVATTGSTLREVGRALRNAGAGDLMLVAIAH